MTDEISLAPERIREHAKVIDDTTVRMAQARDAAAHIILGTEAYGVFCQALPVMMAELHDDYVSVLDQLKDALGKNANAVRRYVDDTRDTDGHNARDIDTVMPR